MGGIHCKIEKFGNFYWWYFYGGSHQTRDLYLACMIESSSTGQIKTSQQYAQCLRGKNMLGFERLKEKLELGEDEQF